MRLKTYQAPSIAEALSDVKRELGRDAVIVHTRSFKRGRWFGLLGRRPTWEVTAAPDLNVVPRPGGALGASLGELVVDERSPAASETEGKGAIDRSVQPAQATLTGPAPAPVDGQLAEIQRMLSSLMDREAKEGRLPNVLREYRDLLCAQDVDEEIADELISNLQMELTGQELGNRDGVRRALRQRIAARLPRVTPTESCESDAPRRGRIVALVGPTGVGKTTTVAKLAANLKLKENKRVGLITMDTYRIAAVDQLRTYAEIIEVPLRTVLTPEEMRQTVEAMEGMDAILIDTVGRSQNDPMRLGQLRAFLEAAGPDEVHLVVSSTINRRCVTQVVKRFAPLGVNRLILTKLDEAEVFGTALNASYHAGVPLSWVSTGQEVPDDLAPADPQDLALRIVGEADDVA
jgi:flagellar biosynthesis protein FlhF